MSIISWRAATRARPLRASPPRRKARGQALVELAIALPLFLLVVGAAIDLGRLFHAYVAIENASKEGAFYGASNPRCDVAKTGCTNPNNIAWRVNQEAVGLSGVTHTVVCFAPNGVQRGSLDSCVEGDTLRVDVAHPFGLVTPILTPIVGNQLTLGATSSALVLNRAFDPNATPAPLPTPTPTPTGGVPTPTPTATPSCTVPNFFNVRRNDATGVWVGAGFSSANISFLPGTGNYRIRTQSVAAGSSGPCASQVIQVGP